MGRLPEEPDRRLGRGVEDNEAPVVESSLPVAATRRLGERIEVLQGDAGMAGSVGANGNDQYIVDAGSGPREIELIRHGAQLQIIGAQTDEITIATAWPFDRSVEDADAHPASPLPGRVVELRVKAGDAIARGDVLAVVEGMKMQHAIKAGRAGRIAKVLAHAGDLVDADTVLFDIESP